MAVKTSTVIIFSPHLSYPLRNGADIYIDRLACHLSSYRDTIFVLGTNTLIHYETGKIISQSRFSNNLHTKTRAALRTLILKSHYLVEKFLTNTYRQMAKKMVQEHPDALVVYSFIATANLEVTTKPSIILTHNDEITWFQDQFSFSNNPLQKLTARTSEKWVKKFLNNHAKDFIFVHITEIDYQGYTRWMPEHKGFVVPAGVDISELSNDVPFDGIIRLLFVGSLSVKMNYDALVFFQKHFWPIIKNDFSEKIEVIVLGSQPSNHVRQLCKREKWQLLPDASNEELQFQYKRADFSILPHSYTNGAKLKLLNSLAAGLPVLATTNMKILPDQEFFPNLYSDNPLEWRDHLKKFRSMGISLQQRESCRQFASQYKWEKIAANMDKKLRQMGV